MRRVDGQVDRFVGYVPSPERAILPQGEPFRRAYEELMQYRARALRVREIGDGHGPFDFFAARVMNSDRDVARDVVRSTGPAGLAAVRARRPRLTRPSRTSRRRG